MYRLPREFVVSRIHNTCSLLYK